MTPLGWVGVKGSVIERFASIQKLVFRILAGILWLAPIGAFGSIAKALGHNGFDAFIQMGVLMLAVYITCLIFVFGVLGVVAKAWWQRRRCSNSFATSPANTC